MLGGLHQMSVEVEVGLVPGQEDKLDPHEKSEQEDNARDVMREICVWLPLILELGLQGAEAHHPGQQLVVGGVAAASPEKKSQGPFSIFGA